MLTPRPLVRSEAAAPSLGADLPLAEQPRTAEHKGRQGSGAAAAGADGPLCAVSTGVDTLTSTPSDQHPSPPDFSKDPVVRFLATDPAFVGIGVARSSKLREAFGVDLPRVLGGGDVDLLAEVVGQDRAETLVAAWQEHLAKADVIVWLAEHGFEAYLATKVVQFWGAEAVRILRDNPYVLMAVASWARVDAAARRLGVDHDDPRRHVAAVEAVAYRRLDRSHTWTPAAEMDTATARLLNVGIRSARVAVQAAVTEGAVVSINSGYQPVGAHVMERFVSEQVAIMLRAPATEDLLVGRRATAAALESLSPEISPHLKLNELQQAAVAMALTSPISLLLGGAGVGKTSTLAAIHRAADRCGTTVVQMALSGRAAMRMREATGREARTITGFLRACENGKLHLGPDRLIVVDEASMLDLPLFYSILRRMREGCHLLLVGDPNQLPPIKFGLTFHLLAETQNIPKIELTEVHRQAARTGIPVVAQAIRDGMVPQVPGYEKGMRTGVSFLECSAEEAVHAITDVLSDVGDIGGETRVLSPVRKGLAGTEAINEHLQQIMSPGRARLAERALAVGDPVMFTRNDYARDLQNGSLGTVLGFPVPGVADVEFDGRRVTVAGADLDNLALAYCLTVHKAQGSQFRRVILPVFGAKILDRSLLYTAITRATEQVVIVGDRNALAEAIAAPAVSQGRETALGHLLHQSVGLS